MLQTVVVAAIVIAAFGLVVRSFYRAFTGKEDDHIYGGPCAGACGECVLRAVSSLPQIFPARRLGTASRKKYFHLRK